MISIAEISRRRLAGDFDHLDFDNRNWFLCSLIGNLDILDGLFGRQYLRTDESEYPCHGLSVLVVGLSSQRHEIACLLEKFVSGHAWSLAYWEVDSGRRQEIMSWGHRWNIPVWFDTVGNEFGELANNYKEALCA